MHPVVSRALVPLAAFCLLLGGCSATTSARASSAVGADSAVGSDSQVGTTENGKITPQSTDSVSKSAPESPAVDAAQLTRSATVSLVVADPAAAATRLRSVAIAHGGMVTSENVVTGTKDLYAQSTLVLSVPASDLDSALADVAAVGDVTLRTITTTDVTTKVADVDARISSMRASIARIQDLLGKAGSVTEIAAVETELTTRQSELESLLAQQKSLANRVAQSPITVTLSRVAAEPEPAPAPPATGFVAGLKAGWKALTEFAVGLGTVVGAVLPFAVTLLVVAAPVVWYVRRRRTARTAAGAPDAGSSSLG